MEFISAEEFLKQDEKVQKVFLEWWKPSIGDLYFRNEYKWTIGLEEWSEAPEMQCIGEILTNNNIKPTVGEAYDRTIYYDNKLDVVPLLTEGQLRKFIEDKTGAPSIIEPIYDKGYEIRTNSLEYDVFSGESFFKEKSYYEKLGTDLLKAYWKVAVQIAEQEGKKND